MNVRCGKYCLFYLFRQNPTHFNRKTDFLLPSIQDDMIVLYAEHFNTASLLGKERNLTCTHRSYSLNVYIDAVIILVDRNYKLLVANDICKSHTDTDTNAFVEIEMSNFFFFGVCVFCGTPQMVILPIISSKTQTSSSYVRIFTNNIVINA